MSERRCPDCGAVVPLALTCCQTCGARLPSEPSSLPAAWSLALFLVTPALLVALAVAASIDLGSWRAWPVGVETGTSWVLVYLLGSLLHGFDRWRRQRPWSPLDGFVSGMFGVAMVVVGAMAGAILRLAWQERLAAVPTVARNRIDGIVAVGLTLGPLLVGWGAMLRADSRRRQLAWPVGIAVGMTLVTGSLAWMGGPGFWRTALAIEAQQRGLIGPAMALARQAVALQPDLADAWLLHGTLLTAQGAAAGADPALLGQGREALARARQLSPHRPDVLLGVAMGHTARAEHAEAGELLRLALASAPENLHLLEAKAGVCLQLGDAEAAIDAYKRALALAGDDPVVLNNLAYTMLQVGRDPVTALTLARESVRLLPDQVFNLDTLAWALYHNGMHDEALEIMERIHPFASGSPDIDFHRLVIAHQAGIVTDPASAVARLLQRLDVRADRLLTRQVEAFGERLAVAAAAGAAVGSATTALVAERGPGSVAGPIAATASAPSPAEHPAPVHPTASPPPLISPLAPEVDWR